MCCQTQIKYESVENKESRILCGGEIHGNCEERRFKTKKEPESEDLRKINVGE